MDLPSRLKTLGAARVEDLQWVTSWSTQTSIRRVTPQLDDLDADTIYSRPLLSDKGKRRFLLECWNMQLPDDDWQKSLDVHYTAYFRHYSEACLVFLPVPLCRFTHQNLCAVVSRLAVGNRATCEAAVSQCLPTKLPRVSAVNEIILFVGTAILMLDLSDWKMNETLKEFITRCIGIRSSLHEGQRTIPPSFNARTLTYKAGIKILWTSNLLSHLVLSFGDTCLKVFHHNAVLGLYECSTNPLYACFPEGYIAEMRRTLWLLLPQAEKSCMKWFRDQQLTHELGIGPSDIQHLSTAERNIRNFDVWRDRLITAMDAVGDYQPKKITPLRQNDRSSIQGKQKNPSRFTLLSITSTIN